VAWLARNQVNGIPPEERYAHAACFVELPVSEGGDRLVILGGVGCVPPVMRGCVVCGGGFEVR
jgi:hypothetical protein